MRSDEIRRAGTALRQRVIREVDAPSRLEMVVRAHRRHRLYRVAFAIAAVLLTIVGVALLSRTAAPPVAPSPPTTFETVPDDTELGSRGVAPEDPAQVQSLLDDLRASAGPGRIVGFVHLGPGSNTGPPDGPSQPVCEGDGPAGIAHAGQGIFVTTGDGAIVPGDAFLTGALYDDSAGCTLWFDVSVPPDLEAYLVQIGGRPPVAVARDVLDRVGWIIDLWSPAEFMAANCPGVDDSQPMTCLPTEGVR